MSPRHLSMRVPWRDRAWDERLCSSPLDNGACLLLANIGERRDDAYERSVSGKSIATIDQDRVPCLSERGTFMSEEGYRLTKTHPYAFTGALKGHLLPTPLIVPGFTFEAVPFRWLSRQTFEAELQDSCPDYEASLEDSVHQLLQFEPQWIMDGRNQRVVMDEFFRYVEPDSSLVFVYLKHSPLQEGSTRRLLVGAARVTGVTPPPMWNQSGEQPFDSSMWETLVSHSLRPDQRDGVLLPYQRLVELMDDGVDVSGALAWAPEGRDREFSYVTEHVSDDGAIGALGSLRAAVDGARALGVEIPQSAVAWLDAQIERVWRLRGAAPGLPAVLSYLGVENAHRVARTLVAATPASGDPWPVLESALEPSSELGRSLAEDLPPSFAVAWQGLAQPRRAALVILSAMDVTAAQVRRLMTGGTTIPLDPAELVDNPYYAATCTYRHPEHVGFSTIDRACFPAPHVVWPNLVAAATGLTDPGDRRRVEALMVDVLERLAVEGDTIAAQADVIGGAAETSLDRPCPVTAELVTGHGLDARTLIESDGWTPIVGAELAGGAPAYKLTHLADAKATISESLGRRRQASRFVSEFDARQIIDDMLAQGGQSSDATDSAAEDLARTEKAVGLAELYGSRLSVLVGPAGTGKTTLLRALVHRPDIDADGVLLLAPTGKARVQLESKVGHRAETLASFLVKRGGFDPDSGRYTEVKAQERVNMGLVVIDEASMLTEEMLASLLSSLGSVRRLILVGDHRQLPPIGAGRPFVDLVEWLRPEIFEGPVRVGPGYVELTVFRRQQQSEARDRDDLALAAWFGGGDLPGAADAVWQRLRNGEAMDTVDYYTWDDGDIVKTLDGALRARLKLFGAEDVEKAFKLTYGGHLSSDGRYVNWATGPTGAAAHCEDWQVLSPARSRVFGTVEINRYIKRTFRTGDLTWARNYRGSRPPKPIGPEQIVYGDKVMQTCNESWRKAFPRGSGFDYIANGEIGVAVGRIDKNPQWLHVEFSSQLGARYSYRPSSADDQPLELAWAVTVHKSQGSEFGTTFLVLPSRMRLSRELLYTALTRQTKKIIILHEGTVDDLVALASPSNSETARRMTDLFRPAAPREVKLAGGPGRFDANLIHVAPGDVMVRSKNEVIVAGILERLSPGRWAYERPVKGTDGTIRYPDFTVDLPTGDQVLWEHLGLMSNPRYAAEWEAKKRWYVDQGYRPYDEPGTAGNKGVLLWTDDRDGVDQPAWTKLAESVIGTPELVRRPAKKSVPRR